MLFTLKSFETTLIITSTCTRAYNLLGIVLSRISMFKLYGFRPALFQVCLYIYCIYNTYIKRGIKTQKIT